jgi:hypothetical protein
MSSGHIVDRFVYAAYPHWPEFDDLPDGEFHASPEIARMLEEHAKRFAWDSHDVMFGHRVITDPAVPRGEVRFVR